MYLRSVKISNECDNDTYPFSIPSLKGTDTLEFGNPVTFFVGENGSGKSTLLEAIAYQCGFNVAGGGRNNNYRIDSCDAALGDYIRLAWLPKMTKGFFLRAESFYHFASHLDELGHYEGYGGRSLHEQSHGEGFLSLFTNRFGEEGIYLLDEPEAALSPARQLAFLKVMHDLVNGSKAQFIIATHSPILLSFPGAQIYDFDSSPIGEIAYEETDHYRLTLNFLTGRERFFHELFRDEENED